MTKGSGVKKLGTAELVVTSLWPLAASEARFGDVPDETLFTFSFCCQCLHAVFALFTLKHDHNKALGARGEAALPLSQGQAAVHRHHRLQVQHGGSQVTAYVNKNRAAILRQNGQTTAIFQEVAACFALCISEQAERKVGGGGGGRGGSGFCGRKGRQRLYLKKRPLVLLYQMH